ncbi:hypothetical protein BJ741DRAFT_119841 [Chytriomyces cf. hyalinus JEL632]|nr:hypothetical protein BJ741DRAFT_119841 [Chytriomyces cf. hyalinus JEL632]
MNGDKENEHSTGNHPHVHFGNSTHENESSHPQANEDQNASASAGSSTVVSAPKEASPLSANLQITWNQEFGFEWENSQSNNVDVAQTNLLADKAMNNSSSTPDQNAGELNNTNTSDKTQGVIPTKTQLARMSSSALQTLATSLGYNSSAVSFCRNHVQKQSHTNN